MGRVGWVLRTLFGAMVVLYVIWFLSVGSLANHGSETTAIIIPSTQNFKQWKLARAEKHPDQGDLDLIYVSKRRVPTGPDPIHNRRAVACRQPPGRT